LQLPRIVPCAYISLKTCSG